LDPDTGALRPVLINLKTGENRVLGGDALDNPI
jgi:hypothetical protein